MLLLIPVVKSVRNKNNSLEDNIHLFKEFEFFYPGNLKTDDYYPPPNNHFNNNGHKKFGHFIIKVLKKKGYFPLNETAQNNPENVRPGETW